MPSKNDIRLYKQNRVTEALLLRARSRIEMPAEGDLERVDELLEQFSEYLDHKELELALDMLEEVGDLIPCRGGFWRDLERAAEMMELEGRIPHFREKFSEALARLKRDEGGNAA